MLMFGWDFLLMLSRDSEDEMWSRFVFELVIWLQEVTLARWTQPSGPLCLWQCFLHSLKERLAEATKSTQGETMPPPTHQGDKSTSHNNFDFWFQKPPSFSVCTRSDCKNKSRQLFYSLIWSYYHQRPREMTWKSLDTTCTGKKSLLFNDLCIFI